MVNEEVLVVVVVVVAVELVEVLKEHEQQRVEQAFQNDNSKPAKVNYLVQNESKQAIANEATDEN